MTDLAVAGRSFPIAFERRDDDREEVLLGIIRVGAIQKLPHSGRYCWSIDLPYMRQMHGAGSLQHARDLIVEQLSEWLEAASAPHRVKERSNG